jgi:flavorubredoxin
MILAENNEPEEIKDMSVTNQQTGTNVNEIADGIYRISTPIPPDNIPGGFSFNQFLIVDEDPLLYHTGLRKMFSLTLEAVRIVLPPERIRYIGVSHTEADECGALNDWLTTAPRAAPLCGKIAAAVSIVDLADRAPQSLADGEVLRLGTHSVKWFDTPHLPHAWDCGHMMELQTQTLLCGDLFTQSGDGNPAITEADILGPSESFRKNMDYYSHSKKAPVMIEWLANENPSTLACMHGSVWKGDGARLLRALAQELSK